MPTAHPPNRFRFLPLGLFLLFTAAIGLAVFSPSPMVRAEHARVSLQTNVSKAWRSAKRKRRPLVLLFTSRRCYYCDQLKLHTLGDMRVQTELSNHFVAVSAEAARYPELVQHLKVRVYPTTVIISPEGKVIDSIPGYAQPGEFQQRLRLARSRSSQSPQNPR